MLVVIKAIEDKKDIIDIMQMVIVKKIRLEQRFIKTTRLTQLYNL